MDTLFKVLKWLFIPLILMVARKGTVYAFETDDTNLVFSTHMLRDLSERLSAIEKQRKIQHEELEARDLAQQTQNDILQHRLAELEARDLAQQTQNGILQHGIAELEARDLAQQTQNDILQHGIAELEARDLAQQTQNDILQHRIAELEAYDLVQQKQRTMQLQRIAELEAHGHTKDKIIANLKVAIISQELQIEKLNGSITKTNQAYHNLHDALSTRNVNTKESEIEAHKEDNSSTVTSTILTRRQQSETDTVAFTAILVHSITNMGLDQNVVFDKVETNIGNAYNLHHGVFTAPVAGTYVFHVSIMSHRGSAEGWFKIVVNGVTKVGVYAKGGTDHDDQGSQTLVVRLNQGDDVAVQNSHYQHGSVFGNDNLWTTFSGYLLRSDDVITTIVG